MERFNKEFWPLSQNRSSSASTHLMNYCEPPTPTSHCPCERYLRTYLAWRKKPFPESFCTWKVFIRKVLVFVPMLRCYFRPDICHEYHELYLWRKNLNGEISTFHVHMTLVRKLKIPYLQNLLQFMPLCC